MYVLILGDNVLSLVMRDQGIMRFVKYVSAAAPGKSHFDSDEFLYSFSIFYCRFVPLDKYNALFV
jgi:hypothetical protein